MIDQNDFYANMFVIISSVWILYISIKIYLKWKLKGSLIFIIGGLISSFALLISPLPKMLFLIGTLISFIGLTIGATVEYEKSRELYEAIKMKDLVLGKIPKYEPASRTALHRTPNLWLNLGVIITAIVLYFVAGIKNEILLFVVIAFLIIIIYHLFIRQKREKV